jgi:DNA topoisomerase-1
VTLNLGPDDPIPICPIPGHAWRRIQSNTSGTWLCHFKDERSAFINSKGKYVFLAAESKIKGQTDLKKYEKAKRLKGNIGDIRKDYTQKITGDDIVENQLGVCTYLIDHLALRVGNEKGEDEADTVGCCSLKVKNMEFPNENEIKLDFLGKDSIRYENTVQVPKYVYEKLRKFAKGKEPDDLLFDRINTSKLNDYLKSMMHDLSAKVFRTYNASFTLSNQLHEKNEHGIDPSEVPDMPLEKRL